MPENSSTSFGTMKNGEYHLRNIPISNLMRQTDFLSAVWLVWTGEKPNEVTGKILNACFVACLDHGTAPPSAQVTRIVSSCGKPLADAVAAGLLSLGPRHGNAASAASEWLRQAVSHGQAAEEIVQRALEQKQRLPGLGHPEYEIDPRAVELIRLAKAEIKQTPHSDLVLEVSRLMTEKKGKPLPVNIDGALGAILADLSAPAELANAIFLVARSAGLVAHHLEESAQAVSYRRGASPPSTQANPPAA